MNFQETEHVAADPDRVYHVLADPDNLVKFVPQLTSIERKGGDKVEVVARYEGHTQHGEAWLHTDDDAYSLEWGVDGSGYHGLLAVKPDGEGSKLVLELKTVHDGHDLEHEVAGTLDSIRRLLESQV